MKVLLSSIVFQKQDEFDKIETSDQEYSFTTIIVDGTPCIELKNIQTGQILYFLKSDFIKALNITNKGIYFPYNPTIDNFGFRSPFNGAFHFTITYDGSRWRYYKNGIKISSR